MEMFSTLKLILTPEMERKVYLEMKPKYSKGYALNQPGRLPDAKGDL